MATLTIHAVLAQFREAATSNRDLGDRFERLICRYLELDPLYTERFSRVWMWNEFPLKGNVGDVGIDVVAEERATGEYCAIQCKFYLPEHTLSKDDIDSFFTAAGKSLFTSCMIVSTTDKWGKNAEQALANQSKPVTRLRVQDLDASPIDWSKFDLKRPQDLTVRKRKTPKDHQKDALKDVVRGLAAADRGKLIMACGTGKTFTSLCIAEKIAPHGHVLFLVPSLSLLSQSLREWTAESTHPLHSLAVCSDANIGKRHTKGDDDQADLTTQDLAFPATTSARQIVRHYEATHALAKKRTGAAQMTVVFSTYQSIQAVSDAQRAGLPDFDLIRVVIGNPPYSAQQDSESDNNKNLAYPDLDARIRSTYAARSNANLAKNLYDSYIRAIRWASDRINGRGIVGFVTNGSFIDGNAMDGLRASLAGEFSAIYVFNLRGNQRTSGETSRMEGGKIFGSGSRAGIAISLFIRNPAKSGPCELYYHDIGDYLDREEKLGIVKHFQNVNGLHREKKWQRIRPNDSHDWINLRDPAFELFVSLGDKKNESAKTFFSIYSLGLVTNRDAWAYNSSRMALKASMSRLIDAYNVERDRYEEACYGKAKKDLPEIEEVVDADPKRICWTHNLKEDAKRNKPLGFDEHALTPSMYRPFVKQWLYYSRRVNERVYQMPRIFPTVAHGNIAIAVSGIGASKDFSALITDCIPNLHMHDTGQCFPLYRYEKDEEEPDQRDEDKKVPKQVEFLGREQEGELIDGYRRTIAITDAILADFRAVYEAKLTKEDIFYYVYGILHSPEYRTRFASDLKKMLPRIPFTRATADFWKFSGAGRELARWHLNYETVAPYPAQEHTSALALDPAKDFLVQKMGFGRKDKQVDKTTIAYNSQITLTGIPLEAYDYVVNGKPAIEWIMERYQITRDKDSGIPNDPNDWAREHNQPRYILDLLKRVITVSLETMKIVHALPPLNERK